MPMVRAGLMGVTVGLWLASVAITGPATVINANARKDGVQGWTISATIRHDDIGWSHYADGFDVLAPDGALLGHRTLYHPHVNEQPFTRSHRGVEIPDGLTHVLIRATDSVHGPGPIFRLPLDR